MAGLINPDPIVYEEVDEFVSDFLSPSKLQHISGHKDLTAVNSIEILVNTKDTTLGNFGKYLPSLSELTLSNSYIPCIRDIGTAFRNLATLIMSRCHLTDVDGIATLQNLKILDISFNNVNDISPISFLESLQVLDVSNNNIMEIEQVDYLSMVYDLINLTLSNNPVCHTFADGNSQSFKDYVFEKLPNLQKFNNQSRLTSDQSSSNSSESENVVNDDSCAIDKSLINLQQHITAEKANGQQDLKSDVQDPSRNDFHASPKKINRFNRPRPLSASELKPKQSLLNKTHDVSSIEHSPRPGSSGSAHGTLPNDDSSTLTFGSLFFGNPLHAIKDRKTTPSSPLIAKLSREPERPRKSRSRPATAIGLRRSVKMITDDQLKHLESDIRNSKLSKSEVVDTVTSTNHYHLKSPRPPKSKAVVALPTPPSSVQLPTPPESIKRPQTSQGFRAKRYKKTFPSRPSQSVDVMTMGSLGSQRGSRTLRSPIEDGLV